MRIALIAHDSRKELLAQFCTAYVRILSQNELVATGVTGKVVHDACGLPVRCLYPGARGGAEQISSMIACGEIDMLLFFRDPVNARPNEPNAVTLLRLCDTRAIPVATNIATAEVFDPRPWSAETWPGSNCSAGENNEYPRNPSKHL